MPSKSIPSKSILSKYITSNLGNQVCLLFLGLIVVVIVLYFTNKNVKKTVHKNVIIPLSNLFSNNNEPFFSYSGYGSNTLPSYVVSGVYNIVMNNNVITTGNVGSTDLEILADKTSSNDIKSLFYVVKINNNSSSNFDYKHYIIPISNGYPLSIKKSDDNKLTIHSSTIDSNRTGNHTDRQVLSIIKESDDLYIKSGLLALQFNKDNNSLHFRTSSKLPTQKISFVKKDELSYYTYDNGYYELRDEKDDFKTPKTVRLERVKGETQTYHILEMVNDKPHDKYTLDVLGSYLLTFPFILKSNGDYNGKGHINSKFIIQNTESSIEGKKGCIISNKDVISNYMNYTAKLEKMTDKMGLTDAYYFISYTEGSDTYLLTYKDNDIKVVKTDKNITDANGIKQLITSSDGNNIFKISNTDLSYHTLKVISTGRYLKMQKDGQSISIKFDDSAIATGTQFNIFKEHNDYYTLSLQLSEISNENTNIKENGTLTYFNISGDSLKPYDGKKDSNKTKFNFHLIATADDKHHSFLDSSTCAFWSSFNNITVDKKEIFVSISDKNNLYKESQLKNKGFMKSCRDKSPNLKYNPTFLNDDGLFNNLDDKYEYTEDDYRTIDKSNLSTDSKILENTSAMHCRTACDANKNCQEFLHQLDNVGTNSLNNRYNGDCLLLNNDDVSQTQEWTKGASGNGYTAFSKLAEKDKIKTDKTHPQTTFPAVVSKKEDACILRGDSCEDKNYCKKVGNKCLRKCSVDPSSGISDGLKEGDADKRCVGTINDFHIVFEEVERNFGEGDTQHSILVKVSDITFKNREKLLHHPILTLKGGLKVMFNCLGNESLVPTELKKYIEILEYSFDYDNHQVDTFKISNAGLNINIPIPTELSTCIKKGYDVILSLQLVDIYGISGVYLVSPLSSTESPHLKKIIQAIKEEQFKKRYLQFTSLYTAIKLLLNL